MKICITESVLCSHSGDKWEDYRSPAKDETLLIERDFNSLPKVRRTDRISRISLYATISLHKKNPYFSENTENTGIVFSSKFGPYKVCKEYIEQVKLEGYDMGSPTLFSSSVANAAVGYICRALNMNGPMISERGGDGIISAVNMLKSKKANIVYSIAVDEITDYLIDLTAEQKFDALSEVCNLLVLEKEESATNQNADILGFLCGASSFAVKKENSTKLAEVEFYEALNYNLQQLAKLNDISLDKIGTVLLTSQEHEDQWELESKFVRTHLTAETTVVSTRHFFGESFGASFQNAILYGLKSNDVESDRHILVLNVDMEESKAAIALIKRK